MQHVLSRSASVLTCAVPYECRPVSPLIDRIVGVQRVHGELFFMYAMRIIHASMSVDYIDFMSWRACEGPLFLLLFVSVFSSW